MVTASQLAADEKPHACQAPKCHKAFARRSDLVRHMRIHSNDRPFKCNWAGCIRSFIQRSALTVHTRVHTGERPHQCEVDGCGKAFGDSSSLARHRRIHTGRRPYKCPSTRCRKTFCRKTTLKKHARREHPNLGPFTDADIRNPDANGPFYGSDEEDSDSDDDDDVKFTRLAAPRRSASDDDDEEEENAPTVLAAPAPPPRRRAPRRSSPVIRPAARAAPPASRTMLMPPPHLLTPSSPAYADEEEEPVSLLAPPPPPPPRHLSSSSSLSLSASPSSGYDALHNPTPSVLAPPPPVAATASAPRTPESAPPPSSASSTYSDDDGMAFDDGDDPEWTPSGLIATPVRRRQDAKRHAQRAALAGAHTWDADDDEEQGEDERYRRKAQLARHQQGLAIKYDDEAEDDEDEYSHVRHSHMVAQRRRHAFSSRESPASNYSAPEIMEHPSVAASSGMLAATSSSEHAGESYFFLTPKSNAGGVASREWTAAEHSSMPPAPAGTVSPGDVSRSPRSPVPRAHSADYAQPPPSASHAGYAEYYYSPSRSQQYEEPSPSMHTSHIHVPSSHQPHERTHSAISAPMPGGGYQTPVQVHYQSHHAVENVMYTWPMVRSVSSPSVNAHHCTCEHHPHATDGGVMYLPSPRPTPLMSYSGLQNYASHDARHSPAATGGHYVDMQHQHEPHVEVVLADDIPRRFSEMAAPGCENMPPQPLSQPMSLSVSGSSSTSATSPPHAVRPVPTRPSHHRRTPSLSFPSLANLPTPGMARRPSFSAFVSTHLDHHATPARLGSPFATSSSV